MKYGFSKLACKIYKIPEWTKLNSATKNRCLHESPLPQLMSSIKLDSILLDTSNTTKFFTRKETQESLSSAIPIRRSSRFRSFLSETHSSPGQFFRPLRIASTEESQFSLSISQCTVASSSSPRGDSKPSMISLVNSRASRNG